MKRSPRRLEKSLRILRELNEARLDRCAPKLSAWAAPLVAKLEAVLRQHDYDARDKIDARQLSIFDALNS